MLDITAAHRAYMSRQTHSRPSRRTRTAQRFAARSHQTTSPLKAVLCFGNHTYPFNM